MTPSLAERIASVANGTSVEATDRWDANAPSRLAELSNNGDPSYRALSNLIINHILEHPGIDELQGLDILDAGCGLGFLSSELARLGATVRAIDPSPVSVSEAIRTHGQRDGLSFDALDLTSFSNIGGSDGAFDVIVANMTLHCVRELSSFMEAAYRLLKPDGFALCTVPNPDVYLQSRSDLDLRSVDLREAHTFEISFRISGHDPHPAKVFYYHRTVRDYASIARGARLAIANFKIPEQVGPGRPRDIAVIEFSKLDEPGKI